MSLHSGPLRCTYRRGVYPKKKGKGGRTSPPPMAASPRLAVRVPLATGVRLVPAVGDGAAVGSLGAAVADGALRGQRLGEPEERFRPRLGDGASQRESQSESQERTKHRPIPFRETLSHGGH